ncbi:hypothetical protein IFR05_012010 [Cadophora sp. M221]|nr:hypothetical protein IFR05_012010 [Cadophora sp. M221]
MAALSLIEGEESEAFLEKLHSSKLFEIHVQLEEPKQPPKSDSLHSSLVDSPLGSAKLTTS